MTTNEEVITFLVRQKHFVLAVIDEDGSPWAVPLAVKRWEGRVIEWRSALSTVHSQAIEREPRVSMCVFAKEEDRQIGFYAKGTARMSEDTGDGYANYTVTIDHAWLNDETFVKREFDLSQLDGLGA
jgi:predicted pyridoxine 5'-phosphate oxidase superfamily flavin-nucleotide-binding protein